MGGCVVSFMEQQNKRSVLPATVMVERAEYGPTNVKVTEDESDRSGIYRRAKLTDEEHAKYFNDWYQEENLLQMLQRNCVSRGDRRAIAYRPVEKVTLEKKTDAKGNERAWEYVYLLDPVYLTYAQLWNKIIAFGRGLVEIGLPKGSKVCLFEETRWEWITSIVSIWTQEMVGVTVYANLGEDALMYALKEAECGAIICNGKKVDNLCAMMQARDVPNAIVIYLDDMPPDTNTAMHTVVSWTEVVASGEGSEKPYTIQSDNDAEALVMYTSGTTGNPKGVVHTIGSITQGARGLGYQLHDLIGQEPDETYVAYLPAAHIFEFICEHICLIRGTMLCFGSPRTLTDAYARPCGDLTAFEPFFLVGVPRIFEMIKKTVEGRLPPPGTLKRRIFDHAYQARLAALKEGKDTPYWNENVFKIPRGLLGSKLRGICSGGAPLADKTQEWTSVVLGVPVAQGYGMTESVCNACVQRAGELNCVAGQLLCGVEACLLDTEEYKHTDKPHPRGELCIRGNFLFKGYYKQPEVTAESRLAGGWFRTGDVAEIEQASCQVRIIGRIKALAKNLLGEYIALEHLEALLCQHPFVLPNGICVLVDPQRAYIAALVLTDEAKATQFAKEHNVSGTWPDFLLQRDFHEKFAASLAALGKKEGLKPFEIPKRVKVVNDTWTAENGLMTASMKVRRSQIDKYYADTIKALFAEA